MHWSLVYLISEWAVRLVMLVYVPQKRNAAASRTWLLLIFLLPLPGLILYAMFGRIYLPRKRIAQQRRASRMIRATQEQMGASPALALEEAPPLDPKCARLAAFARRLGDFPPVPGNQSELLADYDGMIARLIADIDAASHHVHLLYYIYGDDEPGRRVAEALRRAQRRGVPCRLLLDAVGSKDALTRLAPGLTVEGIEVTPLLPVGLFRHNAARFDLRNHRKIAVIDGRVGYTGSQNIVNPEFVKGYANEELTVRLTGPVVAQLQAVFLADRYFERGGSLAHPELFPAIVPQLGSVAQMVPSGPGYQRKNGQQQFITLLYAARERVVMTTPYFVPDEPFLEAIYSARLRGVEVNLVLSQHANQLLTQLAQRSYYEELLAAGVRIHRYQPHFLHAKHLSIDDELVVIGSTNIDIRSFALNAEVNLVLYGAQPVAALRAVQERYFRDSRLLTEEEWNRRSLGIRTVQNMARLADSLL